ncbi:2-hydroxyacyl-CoA dehydratase [Thermodesulfobacteriota bacterium]
MSESKNNNVEPSTWRFVAKRSCEAVAAYMKEWDRETKEKVSQGEPLIVADVLTPHEILEAMDIPYVLRAFGVTVLKDWLYPTLFTEKGNEHLPDFLTGKEHELFGQCGSCGKAWSNLWKLPKITALILDEGVCSGDAKADELWLGGYDAPVFRLEATATPPFYPRYPGWWEKIKDHWDEMIDPYRLDYRVEELKALIKFLENVTGKTLKQDRFLEVMELVNETQEYFRRARNLIAETVPCPSGLLDQIYIYQLQWHRGTPEVRDLAKLYYEEVKEKVEKGEGICPDERLRIQWVKMQYIWYGDPVLYQQFEEKYGAVFVASLYLSVGADGYARNYLDDPLRALAGRHLFLGLYAGPDWDINEARRHGADGAVMMGVGICPSAHGVLKTTKLAYEASGIPLLFIEPPWTEEKVRSEITDFIETRLI